MTCRHASGDLRQGPARLLKRELNPSRSANEIPHRVGIKLCFWNASEGAGESSSHCKLQRLKMLQTPRRPRV